MGTDKARLVVERRDARGAFGARARGGVRSGGRGRSGRERAARGARGSARRGSAGRAARGRGRAGRSARRCVLLACDLPFVDAALLRLLVEWPGTGTVIPVVDGRFQYACARYGAAAFDEAARRVAPRAYVVARDRRRRLRVPHRSRLGRRGVGARRSPTSTRPTTCGGSASREPRSLGP